MHDYPFIFSPFLFQQLKIYYFRSLLPVETKSDTIKAESQSFLFHRRCQQSNAVYSPLAAYKLSSTRKILKSVTDKLDEFKKILFSLEDISIRCEHAVVRKCTSYVFSKFLSLRTIIFALFCYDIKKKFRRPCKNENVCRMAS